MSDYLCQQAESIALTVIDENHWQAFAKQLSAVEQTWAAQQGFTAKAQQLCCLADETGHIKQVLLGARDSAWDLGAYSTALPVGCYHFDDSVKPEDEHWAAMSWALHQYQFNRYCSKKSNEPRQLSVSEAQDVEAISNHVASCNFVRDLINTPTNDMGPEQLAAAAVELAKTHGASHRIIVGENLNKEGFPAIFQVGQASTSAPRLIELDWQGDAKGPLLILVGKGVCFDTGGLDLKSAAGMLSMKKDMGGAAHALGLAKQIMTAHLPLRLKVLIPAVENSVAGNAYRPSDIITMRDGSTTEITNTDAEGRLVLADALSYACESKPDLLMDFATLTGAARVALGTDIVALFTDQLQLARTIEDFGEQSFDPIWHMPLYTPYRSLLKTPIADRCNAAKTGYGGAITAALFLQDFVAKDIAWLHCDLMGSNAKRLPGRPLGGEAMGLRAIFAAIEDWLVA